MSFYKRSGAILAAALITTLLAPAAVSSAGSGDNQCWKVKRKERAFARKINNARSNRGISKMKLDPELSKVARKHSTTMKKAGSIFHQTSTQLSTRVVGWSMLGENVGVGSTPKTLHKAFMASAPHKANILRKEFKNMGVGTRLGTDGRLYVTVVFQATVNPSTILSMPKC